MENWQKLFLLGYVLFGLIGAFLGYKKCHREKNNLGLVGFYFIYGAFVWADLVIFGFFWAAFTIYCLFRNDWILFLLGQSIFWLVRSHGETVYWFNQQFSTINRNPEIKFMFSKIFHDDHYTLWFVMQIFMQCITVVSAILSLYFGKLWLSTF